jgi:hypothetical protein
MGNGGAFLKGGGGCLAAFFAIGFLCVLLGGTMHIDLGGLLCLFVFGGIIGLVVFGIYRRGFQAGEQESRPVQREDWPRRDDLR